MYFVLSGLNAIRLVSRSYLADKVLRSDELYRICRLCIIKISKFELKSSKEIEITTITCLFVIMIFVCKISTTLLTDHW